MTSGIITTRDPRTVARDVPGILDAIFPQLAPGVVTHLNRKSYEVPGCKAVELEVMKKCSLQHAMLFETAIAAAEHLLNGGVTIDFESSLDIATRRQQRFFDAKTPASISSNDKNIVKQVADNLCVMLCALKKALNGIDIIISPHIPGYQWVASGQGDFAVKSNIVEVKCTNKLFSSSDYRQVMIYWLLSYANSVEGGGFEWSNAVMLNPRLNKVVDISFDDMIQMVGAGRTKVEILEMFSAIVSEPTNRMLAEI